MPETDTDTDDLQDLERKQEDDNAFFENLPQQAEEGKQKAEEQKKHARQAGRKLLKEGKQIQKEARAAVKDYKRYIRRQAVKAALNNPYVRIGIVVVIVIILIIIIIVAIVYLAGAESQDDSILNPDQEQLQIDKSGPQQVPNSTDIKYNISVTYPNAVKEITFTDEMITEKKGQVTIVTGPKGYTSAFDATTKRTKVTWKLSDTVANGSGEAIPGPINQQFNLVVKPPLPDDIVYNFKPTGITIPAEGASGSGDTEYVAPSNTDCGKPEYDRYIKKNPTKKNFGDPRCNFDKNTLYKMLQTMDSTNADRWFFQIAPCESSYNPNAFVSQAEIGTPDAAGAWGLFQMGSSKPPGSPPPAPGKNGPYDRGDVNWQVQASNATTYGKKLKDLKEYWAGARPNKNGTPKNCWLKKN